MGGNSHEKRFKELQEHADFSLETVLSESDMITSLCRYNNHSALAFLSRPQTLRQMLEYAICRPRHDSHLVAHQYPFVCCELLTANSSLARALIQGGRSQTEDTTEPTDNKPDLSSPERKKPAKPVGFTNVQIKFKPKAPI